MKHVFEFITIISLFVGLYKHRKEIQSWSNRKRTNKIIFSRGMKLTFNYTVESIVLNYLRLHTLVTSALIFIGGIVLPVILLLEGKYIRAFCVFPLLWLGAAYFYKASKSIKK